MNRLLKIITLEKNLFRYSLLFVLFPVGVRYFEHAEIVYPTYGTSRNYIGHDVNNNRRVSSMHDVGEVSVWYGNPIRLPSFGGANDDGGDNLEQSRGGGGEEPQKQTKTFCFGFCSYLFGRRTENEFAKFGRIARGISVRLITVFETAGRYKMCASR